MADPRQETGPLGFTPQRKLCAHGAVSEKADRTPPPAIDARRLTKIIEEDVRVTLVRDIDLTIDRGEFVAITGPSGSGKSSLLYLLGLLDVPTSGKVLIDGRDASQLDEDERARLRLERLGFVFQFHFLLPEFTALENVKLPMRALGRLGEEDQDRRARDILGLLGLSDHSHKRPGQLSGGQRQRVAIARSLANDPLVVLADEPTGNLDTASSEQVFAMFRRLVDEIDRTIVIVTHDMGLAARADRHVRLVDGRIVA